MRFCTTDVGMLPGKELYRFGPFELDPHAEELRRAGLVLRLPRQPFRILLLLVSRAGETVSREEIQGAIWGGETYVDFEQGINSAIRQIRFFLGDNAETPRYVRTLPRRGYSFIAQVERVAVPEVEERGAGFSPPLDGLKPVLRPARSWSLLIVVAALILLPSRGPALSGANPRTIAVKPFRVLGPWPQGVDVSAFAAEVQAALAILPRRYVRLVEPDRRAAFAIEGTIQQVAGGTRVIVAAVDPKTKTRLWSETYERAPDRRAGMAIDVAYRVMIEVARRNLPPPRHEPLLRSHVSAAALDSYRRARLERSRSQRERDWTAARELFAKATTQEPRFAEAWSGLSDTWVERALHDDTEALCAQAAQVAKACARRALELQPENAEARSTLGILALQRDYDFATAEEAFRRATLDDPEYVDARFNLAIALIARGEFGQALDEFEVARGLDPQMFALHPLPAMIHLYARRYDDALAVYRNILAVRPQAPHPPFGILSVYVAQRKWDDATAMALSIMEGRPVAPQPATVQTFRTTYRRLEPLILRLYQEKTFDDYAVATYYAQLGDRDRAMAFLDRAVRSRAPTVSFVLVDPRIDTVRGDPRFTALLARTNVGRPARETLVTAMNREAK
jgi:DNA-binding winged helix-turn-helix (wHTH) protein/tetratricopeptide (TPR) repeat protein